ncbi:MULTISPECIES: sulfotransferase [Nonomuraea]|uniref:Sulfotransferase n=2 Tax=Nonomuraea TaxID=83681 RepID=A0ABW1BUX3_9ACTN|nr:MULTISPECIES: sulfotransferase [Nonomuraea]MDA0645648.1 sulfotransferase [Nonomuraea ferruginea]TXK38294.1 sulfotransferase [Nonomuraea sp. C10]
MSGPPVLVTGLPRSGTSWTGKMLAAGGELVYVNEPLNPQHPPGRCPGVLRARVSHRFQYICDDNSAAWLPAFRATVALRYGWAAELRVNRTPYDLARMVRYGAAFTLGQLTGRRALLDDPFAVLSSAWFAERLGCRVIALVRDPVAFVASWQRLGWTIYFHELLEQPLLVRDHPEVLRLRALVGSQDRVAKAAALWRVTRTILSRVPGILVTSYDDLAADPVPGFRDLYGYAGLRWSPAAERRIVQACTGGGPPAGGFAWSGLSRTAYRPMDSRLAARSGSRGLTEAEIARVRELTGPETTTVRA